MILLLNNIAIIAMKVAILVLVRTKTNALLVKKDFFFNKMVNNVKCHVHNRNNLQNYKQILVLNVINSVLNALDHRFLIADSVINSKCIHLLRNLK